MSGPIDLRWDAGAYYILGTSLADGKGYRLQSEPGNIPSGMHAPFLPALVALHELALRTSDPALVGPALRLTTIAFSVAYAIAVFLLLKAYIPWPWAAAVPILGVFQPQYVFYSDLLFPETFFGLFTVIFFILQRNRASFASFLLAGLFAALAFSARTTGVALLVAWVADTILRREYRRLPLVLLMAATPVIAWMAWMKTAESSSEYQSPAYAYQTAPYVWFNVSYSKNIFTLKDPKNPQSGPLTRDALVDRVTTNLRELPVRIGESVSSWQAPRRAIFLALLVFAGVIVLVAQRQFLIVGYLALSIAAVVLTPFNDQFIRYLLPLYPFFALAIFQILTLLAKNAQYLFPAVPPALGQAVIGLVVAAIALVEGRDLRDLYNHYDKSFEPSAPTGNDRLFEYAPDGTELDEALAWLQHIGRSSDVVAATDPQRAYLQTGMKAVLPPFELDGVKAQELIDTVPVRYLVAETEPQGTYYRFTSPLVRDNPGCWTAIWKSTNSYVAIYERRLPAPTCARSP
jgi:hypothetical protein